VRAAVKAGAEAGGEERTSTSDRLPGSAATPGQGDGEGDEAQPVARPDTAVPAQGAGAEPASAVGSPGGWLRPRAVTPHHHFFCDYRTSRARSRRRQDGDTRWALGASPEQLSSPRSRTFKTRVIYWLRCQSSRHFLSLDSSAENAS